jgi:hypothetical protein
MRLDVSLSWCFPCEVRRRCRQTAIWVRDPYEVDETSDTVRDGAGWFNLMRGARVMPLRAAKQSRGLVPACAAAFCAAKRIGLRVQEILPLGALSGAPSVEVRYGSTRCLVNDGAAQVAPVRSGHHPTRGSKPCRDDADNKCFDCVSTAAQPGKGRGAARAAPRIGLRR